MNISIYVKINLISLFSPRNIFASIDVVLDFPYKDCVLEGGQSTEEGMDISFKYSLKPHSYEKQQSKRKEIFFNQVLAKELIEDCKNLEELEKLFEVLYKKYFLNYNLKIQEFKDKVMQENEFKSLDLEEQKHMFLTMLDLNQMYVPKTEMADSKFGITEEDQKLTEEFYGGRK